MHPTAQRESKSNDGDNSECQRCARHPTQTTGYVLATDIASFFIYIDVDELERRLLAISDQTAVVRDLGAFLRGMQQLGVRGLPQGLPPSSPLGNFYLNELDRSLISAGVDYRRYMDDTWMFVDSYAAPPPAPLSLHLAEDPRHRRRPHPALQRPRQPAIPEDLQQDRPHRRPTDLQRGHRSLPRLKIIPVCG